MLRREPVIRESGTAAVESLIQRGAGVGVTTLARAALKRDRTLPVPPGVAAALRSSGLSGGLARGSVCCVSGPFHVSFTAMLLAEVSASGSWIAWCSRVAPNCRALRDAGWHLDRFVWANPEGQWAACLGAVVGECEVVVTQIPHGVSPREVRHVAAIVRRSNGVLVVLVDNSHAGSSVDTFSAEAVFEARSATWSTAGAGHLSAQQMHVVLGGRRVVEPQGFPIVLGGS